MVGADLAKEVIQVCTYTNKKVHSNVEMKHHEFLEWLFSSKQRNSHKASKKRS
tara:strand:+ start:10623 stop:10781 length:159 start_codon:yes stop_codon:yes gene_type:complete